MTYQEAIDFLYSALPMFQRVGASAFKKDLSNTLKLCAHLGNPESKFKSIHVAGTNGKGSSSHMLASVFQSAGYKTGLYTSPHLKSFTERIRINGIPIKEKRVIQFVEEQSDFLLELKPSFFEMTVAMAFWEFAYEKVDIAIIEVGMGGRLDSTNVISPEACLITTIGYDHMQYLGTTLPEIAGEKAGIIKSGTPVIISQTQKEITDVFENKAKGLEAPISFADQNWKVTPILSSNGLAEFQVEHGDKVMPLNLDLLGSYQKFNLPGVLETLEVMKSKGWSLGDESVKKGLSVASKQTGLKGRWQILSERPMIICDTGHNESGFEFILSQLATYSYEDLWMVLGFVEDKVLDKVLSKLPKSANYIFCQADLPRAMDAEKLNEFASRHDLKGIVIPSVNSALAHAKRNAAEDDLIFIGGSTFVVAEIEEL
ncbi:bifunctional folylpolyglutamate synthase/dihydrofolate synthase [Algoriphagus sediminis]|uniref:Dihydrofolate synthase/folylpolyglutamate synthase n=1 Tax=Algoriphagus sediminis TaxID=3057113 RepID=A0ABT7YAS1_9BACT|nr:folylpolyglutamate synthase/dihydrofolate synthase family protein [Algoriphagus sediminis]MDN3203612.1 folylpolyglutamate synthase/dihydrofolate synthase family protein [Algoriphagus sediminis]